MNLTFGIELEFADVRSHFLRKHLPAGWEAQGDNSIRNSDGTLSDHSNPMSLGAEVKTVGGWALDSLIAEIPAIYELVAGMGGTVNASTGLHVHVAFGEWGAEDIMRLLRYFGSSPAFGPLVGISKLRQKWFCSPVNIQFVSEVASYLVAGDLDGLKQKIARVPRQRAPFRERDVNVLSLLDHGTIEYRAFSQTMNPDLAINCLKYSAEVTKAALAGAPLPHPTLTLPETL